MFAIAANLETASGKYRGSKQLPTFFLHENVQGILSEERAVEIAAGLISDINPAYILNVNMWITAERV